MYLAKLRSIRALLAHDAARMIHVGLGCWETSHLYPSHQQGAVNSVHLLLWIKRLAPLSGCSRNHQAAEPLCLSLLYARYQQDLCNQANLLYLNARRCLCCLDALGSCACCVPQPPQVSLSHFAPTVSAAVKHDYCNQRSG
jgi:hypothetical protein